MMQHYAMTTPSISFCGKIRSPFYIIRDAAGDEVAILAGMVKQAHEKLDIELRSLARLTSPTYRVHEDRARAFLEALIDAKRAYETSQKRGRY